MSHAGVKFLVIDLQVMVVKPSQLTITAPGEDVNVGMPPEEF